MNDTQQAPTRARDERLERRRIIEERLGGLGGIMMEPGSARERLFDFGNIMDPDGLGYCAAVRTDKPGEAVITFYWFGYAERFGGVSEYIAERETALLATQDGGGG